MSSLSAILLDTDYYDFIMARRRVEAGLSWVGEDRQIPLKAVAWQEISTSKEVGVIPSTRKMCGNTLTISFACQQLLAQDTRIEVIARVANILLRFLDALWADDSVDPKTLKLEDVTAVEFEIHIVRAYGLT